MKLVLTYGNLLNYDRQIQNQIKNNTVCSFFNRSKIKQFYDDYDLRIETAKRETSECNLKFLEFDENKKVITDNGIPKVKEGFTLEQYNEELNKILLREVLM